MLTAVDGATMTTPVPGTTGAAQTRNAEDDQGNDHHYRDYRRN